MKNISGKIKDAEYKNTRDQAKMKTICYLN